MPATRKPLINLTELEQLGIVVYDIEKSMKHLQDTFGIGPWKVYLRDPDSKVPGESITDMLYYGKPTHFSYLTASTQNKVGGFVIELIQPVSGDNIYQDFLKQYGEGVQHLGWHFVETFEEYNEVKKRLEDNGFPCTMSARVYHAAFAYFDTRKVLNTTLEVVWKDTSRTRPAPKRFFHDYNNIAY